MQKSLPLWSDSISIDKILSFGKPIHSAPLPKPAKKLDDEDLRKVNWTKHGFSQ